MIKKPFLILLTFLICGSLRAIPEFDTTKNSQFEDFSTAQLIDKTSSEDPIERISAFYYLVKNEHKFDLGELFEKTIHDTVWIKFKVRKSRLISPFTGEGYYETYYEKKKFRLNHFLYFTFNRYKNQIYSNYSLLRFKAYNETLDSVIINSEFNTDLKRYAIESNRVKENESYYIMLREMLVKKEGYSPETLKRALVKLAEFKKEEDTSLILSYDLPVEYALEGRKYMFEAIASFPHPHFIPYLMDQLEKTHRIYVPINEKSPIYQAIKAYGPEMYIPFLEATIKNDFIHHEKYNSTLDEIMYFLINEFEPSHAPLIEYIYFNHEFHFIKKLDQLKNSCAFFEHQVFRDIQTRALVEIRDAPNYFEDTIGRAELFMEYGCDTAVTYYEKHCGPWLSDIKYKEWKYRPEVEKRIGQYEKHYPELASQTCQNTVYFDTLIAEFDKIVSDSSYSPDYNKKEFVSILVDVHLDYFNNKKTIEKLLFTEWEFGLAIISSSSIGTNGWHVIDPELKLFNYLLDLGYQTKSNEMLFLITKILGNRFVFVYDEKTFESILYIDLAKKYFDLIYQKYKEKVYISYYRGKEYKAFLKEIKEDYYNRAQHKINYYD